MTSIYSGVIPNILQSTKPSFKTIKFDKHTAVKIGAGAFGVAYRITDKNTGKDYVIKMSTGKIDSARMKVLVREATILLPFKDVLEQNFIIQYLDFKQQKRVSYTLMEYFPFPEMLDFSQKSGGINRPEDFYAIAKNLFTAVAFLHRNNIVHRDIKLENILYDHTTHNLRLIDFGFACDDTLLNINDDLGCLQDKRGHTSGYIHPRMADMLYDMQINNNPADTDFLNIYKSNDVWACATVLYILVAEDFPEWDTQFYNLYSLKTRDVIGKQGIIANYPHNRYLDIVDPDGLLRYCFDLDGKATAQGALDICLRAI